MQTVNAKRHNKRNNAALPKSYIQLLRSYLTDSISETTLYNHLGPVKICSTCIIMDQILNLYMLGCVLN